jgi:hypothetical protein
MGDRHDAVIASNEEAGSTGSSKQVYKRENPVAKKTAGKIRFRP